MILVTANARPRSSREVERDEVTRGTDQVESPCRRQRRRSSRRLVMMPKETHERIDASDQVSRAVVR
jgi:hypothetical protein